MRRVQLQPPPPRYKHQQQACAACSLFLSASQPLPPTASTDTQRPSVLGDTRSDRPTTQPPLYRVANDTHSCCSILPLVAAHASEILEDPYAVVVGKASRVIQVPEHRSRS
ncbi:unnamed protein product [Acanthoscelides obtectus]|uniref:Uncharacterized protein n=1 Tax=Acanthoscelides obtectus TaxID=200917 RepID=A0A9P0KAY6_ACAOB|nr:unnamed protein product [Acanthoscelides obtectus]CAK1666901.1 hypothetical protein AOBTE_LOCUS25544 [Acanthoscelides obtectus]